VVVGEGVWGGRGLGGGGVSAVGWRKNESDASHRALEVSRLACKAPSEDAARAPNTHVEGVAGVRRHLHACRRGHLSHGAVARLGVRLHVGLEAQVRDLGVWRSSWGFRMISGQFVRRRFKPGIAFSIGTPLTLHPTTHPTAAVPNHPPPTKPTTLAPASP